MYWFRIRFDLPNVGKIASSARQLVLERTAVTSIVLAPVPLDDESTIVASRNFAVVGKGYDSVEAAQHFGQRWRDWLITGFGECHIGADLGDRTPQGHLTEAALSIFSELSGAPVFYDRLGLSVLEIHPGNPDPQFVSLRGSGVSPMPASTLANRILSAMDREVFLTDQQRLAYDLYAAAFFQPSADARFMMLAMSLETLIQPLPRDPAVVAQVQRLIELTKASEIPASEKNSIAGSLRWLRKESIGQAGRRLASRLSHNLYMEGSRSAQDFFTATYSMRSRLAHGHYPRPTVEDVDRQAAALVIFVGDLLTELAKEQGPVDTAGQ